MLVESKVIAVDFDGTIVQNKYPKIGKPLPFAFETLKMLQNEGHRLVLWTVRTGTSLQEAVDFCRQNGLEFYAVNEAYEGEHVKNRKLNADIFIDDRNVGGLLQWGEIYQLITGKGKLPEPKKGWKAKLGW